MQDLTIAVVGATGAVGAEFLRIVESRYSSLPKLKLLASNRSAGKVITVGGQELVVEEATEKSFDGVDVAFISASSEVSHKLAPAAVAAGAVVIDDGSAFRMEDTVPLVVPEVNGADVEWHQGIISIPNCSTTPLVMVAHPLHQGNSIKRIVADTYQSVSGAGGGAMADLREQRTRLTGELSLGWKQRLALGCAVLHEPPVLFLDEPTSGVDPLSRRSFWDLIYELAAEGTTVFVTTHYMEEADYCHRLALMNRGQLIALNSPSALRQTASRPLLEVRTSEAPRAVHLLQPLPGVTEVALFGRTLHVSVESTAEAIPRITTALETNGIGTPSIRPIVPSLEDVFVELVTAAGGAPTD